jgi:2-oxoglutarate dehydrogenase E1 component
VGGAGRHENQGRFEILNTMLSEEAVLGFEWGFSSADPRNLVIWEAQFGDFVNGAQAVIDQILAAAESKWGYMNGIVLNLPHGYEGQGPEHSNAYLERWLSLCADNNMQVVNPTTPAQYFHLLRRQVRRPFRKPLIIMAPKSLLRKPEAASRLANFTDSGLQLTMADPQTPKADGVRRVILCSGKVFYALDAARRKAENREVAVLRVEQLYPFPENELRDLVERYRKDSEIVWCQEEPANRGAWTFVQPRLREMFPDRLVSYVGRDASASPAVGKLGDHEAEEAAFLSEALDVSNQLGNGVDLHGHVTAEGQAA